MERNPSLSSRLIVGAIAGIVGTMAMTGAMRRLHRQLPKKERYPLTPREIIDSVAAKAGSDPDNEAAKDVTVLAHFAYGAACGSLLAVADPKAGPASGALAGTAIWLGSYMGWIPAAGILKPATEHPLRRNATMIAAHIVWGAATARAARELFAARETIIEGGPDKDVPPSSGRAL